MSNMIDKDRFSGSVSDAGNLLGLKGLFTGVVVTAAGIGRTKNFCYLKFFPESLRGEAVLGFVNAADPAFCVNKPDGSVEMTFALRTPDGKSIKGANFQGAGTASRVRAVAENLPSRPSYPPVWFGLGT